jgi:hypothetical protein
MLFSAEKFPGRLRNVTYQSVWVVLVGWVQVVENAGDDRHVERAVSVVVDADPLFVTSKPRSVM